MLFFNQWLSTIHEQMICFSLINQLLQFAQWSKAIEIAHTNFTANNWKSVHAVIGQPELPQQQDNIFIHEMLITFFYAWVFHLVIVYRWKQIGSGHQWLTYSHLWGSFGLQLSSGKGDGVPCLQECRILNIIFYLADDSNSWWTIWETPWFNFLLRELGDLIDTTLCGSISLA